MAHALNKPKLIWLKETLFKLSVSVRKPHAHTAYIRTKQDICDIILSVVRDTVMMALHKILDLV
jgi:hypothetical protein